MELDIFTQEGRPSGSRITLEDKVFGIKPNEYVVYLDVRLILANNHIGTHKTKERGEISGSTKKPYRQKGTGNARAGHTRSPLWRHGGTIFGPRPHKYGFKVNRKVKQLARRSMLSDRLANNRLTVVDSLNLNDGKTKTMLKMLDAFKLNDKKALIVVEQYNENVFRSGGNVQKLNIVHVNELNTYDLVNAEHIIVTKAVADVLNKSLLPK